MISNNVNLSVVPKKGRSFRSRNLLFKGFLAFVPLNHDSFTLPEIVLHLNDRTPYDLRSFLLTKDIILWDFDCDDKFGP